MELLLLPGNSQKNEEDFESLKSGMEPKFENVLLHRYRHWDTGEKLINFEYEMGQLSELVVELDEFGIFGKSAGALLAIGGVVAGLLEPKKCVFAGTAIHFARKLGLEIENWLKGYKVPTLFIQKAEDPAYGADDLKSLLEKSLPGEYEFEKIEGDTHDYSDVENLTSMISEFLLG